LSIKKAASCVAQKKRLLAVPPSLPSSVVIVCDVLVQKSLPLSGTRFVFCQCWFILAILFSLEGMVDQPRKAVNNLNPYTSSWLFFAVSWCQAIVTVLCTSVGEWLFHIGSSLR